MGWFSTGGHGGHTNPRLTRLTAILTAVAAVLGLLVIDARPVAAVDGSTSPSTAPVVCYSDTLDAQQSEVNGASVYGRMWIPSGATATFNVSGAILPSVYVGNGRGEYKYYVRVWDPDTNAALWERWNYWGTPINWGGGPYQWNEFSGIGIGSWQNTTGQTKAFVIETWAVRTYAGADTRWRIDAPIAGGATPECAIPHPVSEHFGANLAMPGQCRGSTARSVDTASGNEHFELPGLSVAGRGPGLHFAMAYNSFDATYAGPVGFGWRHSYDMQLGPVRSGTRTVYQENGSTVTFTSNGAGGWTAPARFEATLTQNANGTFTFERNRFELFSFGSDGRLAAIADRNGYTTTLVYSGGQLDYVEDSAGRRLDFTWSGFLVSQITDPLAAPDGPRTIQFTYSGGNLTGYRDVGGGQWALGYDGARRLTSVRTPRHAAGKVLEYHYDGQGRVDWEEDELNRRTTLSYDDPVAGATRVVEPDGDQRVDYYDAEGRCTKKTLGYGTPQATTTELTYDASTSMVTSKLDGRGKQWTYGYADPANPRSRTSVTDPLGRSRSVTYNALGLVTSSTDGVGTVTSLEYDTAGNLEKVTAAVGTPDQAVTDLVRDPAHVDDVTSTIDARGNTWLATYDAATGNRTSMTDPEGNKTTFEYNGIGWMVGTVAPAGNATGGVPAEHRSTYQYNRFGAVTRATNPLGQATVTAYDLNGNVTSVTDPDGDVTTSTYTDADEVATRTVGASTPAAATTTYEYWPDGNLKSWSKAAGSVWSSTYDAVGRRATAVDPDGDTTAFTYDGNGNVLTVTQPGGNCTTTPKTGCVTHTYDNAGQPTNVDYSDAVTADVTVSYDNAGRRRFMTDGTGTSESVWDRLGRLDRHTDGAGETVDYTWDKAGNLDAVLYPGQTVPVDYVYDRAGRMTSVTDWLGNTTNFGYDRNSNLTAATYPADTFTSDAYTYDRSNRLSSVGWNHAQRGSLGRVDYTRDADGLVTSAPTTGLPTGASAYGYDTRDQLETVGGEALRYDTADNLTALGDRVQSFDVDGELAAVHRITHVGTTKFVQSSVPDVTLTLPAGIQADDQIFLIASMPVAQSVAAAPGGYTHVTTKAGGSSKTAVYRRTAVGGETSATMKFSGNGVYDKSMIAVVYRGVDTAQPVAAVQTAATANKEFTIAVGSMDAIRPGSRLLVAESAVGTGAPRWAQPTGMQERADARGISLTSAAGDQLLYATGPTGTRVPRYTGLLSEYLTAVGLVVNPEPPSTFTYDARGNRTSRTTPDGTTSYAFDQADRLTGVDAAATYRYDGDGLRTATTTATGTRRASWSRAGGLPLMLTETPLDGGGAAIADKRVSYVYGPGGRVLTRIDPRPDITLVGARAAADSGFGNSITVPLPPGVQVQDQILVAVTYDKNATVTPPAGYTEVGTRVGQYVTMKLWRRTATGGEASVTVNFGSVIARAGATAVYRGVDPTNPVVDADFGAANGQSVTVPSLDVSGGGDHLVAFPGETQLVPGATTWTHPAGMTPRAAAAAPNSAAAVSDQPLSSAAPTGTRTFGFASAANLVAGGVVLRRAMNQERWYHADQIGSTRLLTDQAGQTVGTATYDAYGSAAATTGEKSDIGFAGEYADPTTGLIYLRARWYDPTTGQFMSRDPALGATEQPYAYAGNDPVNFTDPTGELPILAAVALGALGGAAMNLGAQMLGNVLGGCGAFDNIDWGNVVEEAAIGGALGGAGSWFKAARAARALRGAPRSVPALRQAYMDDVASIADEVAAWQKAGADPEFIAREAWANRRALGIQYKNLTPADELARIHARNLERYGDPLGPSIDWLRSRGRTWEQIIDSATRTGGRDLGY